jgi:hypothetical protein
VVNIQPLRLHSRLAPVFRRLRFTPDHVLADRAYSSRRIRAYLRRRRIPHTLCTAEKTGRPSRTARVRADLDAKGPGRVKPAAPGGLSWSYRST